MKKYKSEIIFMLLGIILILAGIIVSDSSNLVMAAISGGLIGNGIICLGGSMLLYFTNPNRKCRPVRL